MEPIATRHLTWNDGDVARDVLVRMWQPVARERDFVCDFAIDGLPVPIHTHAAGVDTMQALVMALAGIRYHLAPYRDDLSWLETAGFHGIPMSLLVDPADERSIEALVESESGRLMDARVASKKRRRIDEKR